MRRAAPLPNSVRDSALILISSDMRWISSSCVACGRAREWLPATETRKCTGRERHGASRRYRPRRSRSVPSLGAPSPRQPMNPSRDRRSALIRLRSPRDQPIPHARRGRTTGSTPGRGVVRRRARDLGRRHVHLAQRRALRLLRARLLDLRGARGRPHLDRDPERRGRARRPPRGQPDPAGRAARGQRAGGRGDAPLRHQRRRDAPVRRPGRRRDVPHRVLRQRPRASGLRVLRPARPQGDGDPLRLCPRGLDGARQRPADHDRRRRPALRDHAADSDVPVRGLRGSLALGGLGARRAAVRLARAAPRWPTPWSGTRRTSARSRRPASTTTRTCSTSPTRSTPTTRSSRPDSTGAPWRRPAASPSATSCSRPTAGRTPTTSCARW